jgi:tetratricopeptide (TPR) repeat protein
MNVMVSCYISLLLILAPSRDQTPSGYNGADVLLGALPQQHEPENAQPKPERPRDEMDAIITDLNTYRRISGGLPPDEAAARWLEFVDRIFNCPKDVLSASRQTETFGPYGFSNVTTTLPPPAAWDAISKTLDARPLPDGDDKAAFNVILLRLFAHRLTQQTDAMDKDMDALNDLVDKSDESAKKRRTFDISTLESQLVRESTDAATITKRLDRMMQDEAGRPYFSVPDVVRLLGPEKATDFLRKALVMDNTLVFPSGTETRALAAKLAIEMMPELKNAPWQLACSLDATALFEALLKQFPEKKGNMFRDAQSYYLMGLIAAHRSAEAADFIRKLGKEAPDTVESDLIASMLDKGLGKDLTNFYHDLLATDPDLPLWNSYVWSAEKTGAQKQMLELAEASVKHDGLQEQRRELIEQHLRRAYLASGRVDEGIAILRAEIAREKKKAGDQKSAAEAAGTQDRGTTSDSDGRDYNETVGLNTSLPDLGLKLARLGIVLHRDDLLGEGVDTMKDWLKSKNESAHGEYYRNHLRALAVLLMELNRGPEVEALLGNALNDLSKKETGDDAVITEQHQLLVLLMDLYHRANRPADVVKLLDKAPQWQEKDLAGMLAEKVIIDRNPDYVGYFAANSLAATGDTEDARKILEALLERRGDYDPAYELLIKLEQPDVALAKLDALFARDKYENRPLIWKAKLLLGAGKLPEAAATAQQAIEIDPSDGEHGPGRRMFVYSVLADIR